METCSCAECVSACNNDPGRLLPKDIPLIAAALAVTPEELYQRYLVLKVYRDAKGNRILIPAPVKYKGRNALADTGTEVPDYYEAERGRCVFLSPSGECLVHTAKPYECAAYMGCRNTFNGRPYREKQVEDFFMAKWRGVSFLDLLRNPGK